MRPLKIECKSDDISGIEALSVVSEYYQQVVETEEFYNTVNNVIIQNIGFEDDLELIASSEYDHNLFIVRVMDKNQESGGQDEQIKRGSDY